MSTAQEKTSALIAALWQKNRPIVEERVAVLAAGNADHTAMLEAAHKLSGALGMYGFPEASAIASQIESALRCGDVAQIPQLVAALRAAIPAS